MLSVLHYHLCYRPLYCFTLAGQEPSLAILKIATSLYSCCIELSSMCSLVLKLILSLLLQHVCLVLVCPQVQYTTIYICPCIASRHAAEVYLTAVIGGPSQLCL